MFTQPSCNALKSTLVRLHGHTFKHPRILLIAECTAPNAEMLRTPCRCPASRRVHQDPDGNKNELFF